jgi:Insertion element 4 transposase N-terminal
VADNGVVAAGGRLTDWISLGVLASSVPRDAVDEAVAAAGKGAKRSDGKLPPHVMVYFAMALALFAEEDYEEVAARLTETLTSWGCWDQSWAAPTSGGLTQARKRLGPEPLELLFAKVAVPVAGELTRGAFLRDWRLMAIDGFELDVPDTPANAAAFGYPAGAREHPAFPKVRVVTIGECGSHAKVAAQMGPVGGKGSSEQALARRLYPRLEEGWLLVADRGFYNWPDWQAATTTGAALLWRVKADLRLPVLELLPDGSYLSVVARPTLHDKARNRLIATARAGEYLDPALAMRVRVIEYEIPDRDGDGSGELIALITTITDPALASAQELAEAYCQRWEEETGNDQLKTCLRGPGKVLRSKSPDMVRQEIYGYLLTHHAISALICRAATEADIDPDPGEIPAHRPHHPPPGRRPGLSPLTRPGALSPRSWPTSPARATSTHAATAAIPG